MRPSNRERRRRERRILALALGLAATVHVLALLLWQGLPEPVLPDDEAIRLRGPQEDEGRVWVRLRFGPPDILEADGSVAQEPPERTLMADRIVFVSPECVGLGRSESYPLEGSIELVVDGQGYAEPVGIVQPTGDACADEVVTEVGDALRYLWLPTDRFPAPVRVVQPVRILEAA